MQRHIGYVKGNNQVLVKSILFSENTSEEKIVDLHDLADQNLSALFYEENQLEDEGVKEVLINDSKFYPMRDSQEFNLNLDSFEKLSVDEAKTVLNKVSTNWVLQNNITLLEEMFTVVDHLNALWPNDRTAFFEELWFVLKNNLGATNLKLVYNDLKKIGKNEDKNTLIQVMVEGDKVPNPKEGKELEKKLMDNYKEEFANEFNVSEFLPEKNQIVLTGTIKKSPFVLLANVEDFTRLQSSILKTFIKSLSR